jgi:hypothetical protein
VSPRNALPAHDAFDLPSCEPLQRRSPRDEAGVSLVNDQRHPPLRQVDAPRIDALHCALSTGLPISADTSPARPRSSASANRFNAGDDSV